MPKQLQLSEYTTSKLLTLYGNPSDNDDYQTLYSNVDACQPELKLESQTIKLDDIQRKIIDQNQKFIPQPQFVILPCFHLNEQQKSDIITCVYSRDPEDTGLLTFSFTTRSGDVGDVLVVLKAFATATQITNSFHITKSELAGAVQTIAKPRDFKNGKYTANLKIKFDAASMEVQDSSTPIVLFKTYNTAVRPEAHLKTPSSSVSV
ncbi:uncharacterized protein LOC120350205 [Nilaparvata lugens]|uniref:uncharacterized protein LOC120350205 n=1 Tax=Nilaparvata lugens TaxID=108931 RepID=UPI00193D8910|nr:uncharacterized protein LOC120350205 [Nilaparvata lugens]